MPDWVMNMENKDKIKQIKDLIIAKKAQSDHHRKQKEQADDQIEDLQEQLAFLEHGIKIGCIVTKRESRFRVTRIQNKYWLSLHGAKQTKNGEWSKVDQYLGTDWKLEQ